VRRQCDIVKVNSEIKISSNGLCSAKIISDNCEKMCQVSNPTSVKTQQLAPTPPPKHQQLNHLLQLRLNTKFSQHLIFSNCSNSIVNFPDVSSRYKP
jgi:hypothetical protein